MYKTNFDSKNKIWFGESASLNFNTNSLGSQIFRAFNSAPEKIAQVRIILLNF